MWFKSLMSLNPDKHQFKEQTLNLPGNYCDSSQLDNYPTGDFKLDITQKVSQPPVFQTKIHVL